MGIAACAVDPLTAPSESSRVVVLAQVRGSTAGIVVEVSGPGISPSLLFNLDVGLDSVAADTITVPSGGGRRFIVTAVDTFGVATHRGDTTIALVPGVPHALALVLRPLATSVGVTITLADRLPTARQGTQFRRFDRRIGAND